jgi:hypothetical protein
VASYSILSPMIKKADLCVIIIFCLGLFLLRIDSLVRSINSFWETLKPIVYQPHATYDEKMSERFPEYYGLIKRVLSITPDNCVIYTPDPNLLTDKNLWPFSNKAISSGFLFPRQAIPYSGTVTKDAKLPTFVIIANGFPNFPVNATEIYIFNDTVTNTFYGDYSPGRFSSNVIGLIKL